MIDNVQETQKERRGPGSEGRPKGMEDTYRKIHTLRNIRRFVSRYYSNETISVLSNPAETIVTRADRFASYNQIGGKYVVVIHEQQYDESNNHHRIEGKSNEVAQVGFTKV